MSVDDSFDFTQETFFRAFKSKKSFRGEATPKTWLFKIAQNLWLNYLRSKENQRKRVTLVSLDQTTYERDIPDSSGKADKDQPLEHILKNEKKQRLREALDDLPPQMRRCILLRTDQDLKYREIAVVMQLSIETIKALLFQARQRLKEILDR